MLQSAPVSHQPLAESHTVGKELGRSGMTSHTNTSSLSATTLCYSRGRFSKVHKAKHKATGTRHAVKLLRPEVREEAFQHELCVAYHLNHPNIACCFGGVASTRERALTLEV